MIDARHGHVTPEEPIIDHERAEPHNTSAALRRVLRKTGDPHIIDVLTEKLSGTDLTTLLLEVARRRSRLISPPELLRRYASSRFVAPAAVSYAELRRVEALLLQRLPVSFEVLQLAPVLPLGTHSALATVDQNNVIATVRANEVAADPTNGLALEAAARRRRLRSEGGRSAENVRLAGIQRVVRGQRVEGPASFAHFSLMGLVTAGRDRGDLRFERDSAVEHIAYAAKGTLETGADRVRIDLTDFTPGELGRVGEDIRDALSGLERVDVADWPDRQEGRGYYRGFCFKAFATFQRQRLKIADGGLVDWTAQLLQDRKERTFISGLGIDRLALPF
jgi:hypothetical protein